MEDTKKTSVSHTFSHHIYHISTLVSMITGSTKLIDVVHREQSAHVVALLSVGIVHKDCLILEYDATISMRVMDHRPYV